MIRYLFLAGIIFTGLYGKSQAPVANFSGTPVQGCAALVVDFKDLSTGNPKFWNWEFGNGQLSSQQNPTTVYNAPGTYTVKLVVRNADGTNGITKTNYITVNAAPNVDFTSDLTTACLPAVIRFKDMSSATVGSIVKWEWDFGDGTTSTQQNPVKSYTANGFYTVLLKTTTSTGCSYFRVKYGYIRVISGAKANFDYALTSVCTGPFNTTFKNLTSAPGNVSYNWNFGNGNTSTATDPNTTYLTTGTYNVLLIARSELGCSDSIRKAITITSTNTSFTGPDSACFNSPLSFRNTSAPAPVSSRWDFGDSTSSALANPTKTFTRPGTYQVKLVNTYASCIDSLTKTIKIQTGPYTDFSSNVQGSCKSPFSVNFKDLSPDAVKWQWNFGDGSTSASKDPVHQYTTAGEYDVTLTITNATGCTNTITKSKFIKVVAPTVSFANAPAGGCIPFNYTPSLKINAVDAVTNYLWDFGEPGSSTTIANPSYVYTKAGNYTVSVRITTQGGCVASTSVPNGISTGTLPVANFRSDTLQACADSVIRFTNQSVPSGASAWDFGDGTTSTLKDPVHSYKIPGKYAVSLTTYNNGCPNTLKKDNYITVLPPIAKFGYKVDCSSKLAVSFIDSSVTTGMGSATYFWQFGDPTNATSTARNPSFTYPKLGNYQVRLTVTDGVCSNTITQTVSLLSERAVISTPGIPDTVCKDAVVVLYATGNDPQNITEYQWSYRGGAPIIGGSYYGFYFGQNGTFDMQLIIIDKNKCADTGYKKITISGPTAAFTSDVKYGCKNAIATFSDQSTPGLAGRITKWTFDFGDGTTQSYTNPPFRHQYKDTGNYTVKLTVLDSRGCSHVSTLSHQISIVKPAVAFRAEKTSFCQGTPLQFIDSSRGLNPLTYLWNFGDGNVSTQKNPAHTYRGKDSSYTVTLIVNDSAGCGDTLRKLNYIRIKSSKPAFDVKDTTAICPPLETKFFNKAADYESFYWDFGDGVTSTLKDPVHFYNTYGIYTAKLFTSSFGGCVDSSVHTVSVYDPYSTVLKYGPLQACNSVTVDFNVIPPPHTRFSFAFGDGTSDTSQQHDFKHFYKSPGTYLPSLVLKDSLNCQVGVPANDYIRVLGAEPFFSADKHAFCDSGKVFFTNFTITNEPVISNQWNFADGTTSTNKDEIHSFTTPGEYIVSLTATTESGCSKTLTDTIRIYATPNPSIQSDSLICINTPVLLKGVLAVPDTMVKWNWNFGNGESSTLQNPRITYTKEGTYTITAEATNTLGCKKTTTRTVRIVSLPEITTPAEPIIISVGSSVQIPVTYSPNVVTYKWTPPAGLSCVDCPAPVSMPRSTTVYTVNVVDGNGCANAKEITVNILCNSRNYFVPNTFTPNGDGNNDIFYPRGAGVTRIQSMRIFNRWGELVFEKRNFSANSAAGGWDGSFKGRPAASDAYVYIIEFVCENGSIIPYKGNVTLIR